MNLWLLLLAVVLIGCISSPSETLRDSGGETGDDMGDTRPIDLSDDVQIDPDLPDDPDMAQSVCGNGVVEPGELCEPGVPVETMCDEIPIRAECDPATCQPVTDVCNCGFFIDSETQVAGDGTFESPSQNLEDGSTYIQSGTGARLVCVKRGSQFSLNTSLLVTGESNGEKRGFIAFGDGAAPVIDGGTRLDFTPDASTFVATYNGPPREYIYDNGFYAARTDAAPEVGQFIIEGNEIRYRPPNGVDPGARAVLLLDSVFLIGASEKASNTVIRGFEIQNANTAVLIVESEGLEVSENTLESVRVAVRSQTANNVTDTFIFSNKIDQAERLAEFTTPQALTNQRLTIDSNQYFGVAGLVSRPIETINISDVTIRRNDIRTEEGTSTTISTRINDNQDIPQPNLIIEQNFLVGNNLSINIRNTPNAKVRNNIIFNSNVGMSITQDVEGTLVEHNTFVGSSTGFRVEMPVVGDFRFQRNIIAPTNFIIQTLAIDTGEFNYNLYSGGRARPFRLINDQQITFEEWIESQDSDSIKIGIPGFVNGAPVDPEDFQLRSNVAARDPEMNVSETTVDFAGRPRDARPDYGAWEGN